MDKNFELEVIEENLDNDISTLLNIQEELENEEITSITKNMICTLVKSMMYNQEKLRKCLDLGGEE